MAKLRIEPANLVPEPNAPTTRPTPCAGIAVIPLRPESKDV